MLQVFLIHFVEGAKVLAVDVEDGDDVQIVEYGYDNLAAALGGTGDVTREGIDVGHDDGFATCPSGATHSPALLDAGACQGTLEGTKDEFAIDDTLEACPPETKGLVEHACHIRHVGDGV